MRNGYNYREVQLRHLQGTKAILQQRYYVQKVKRRKLTIFTNFTNFTIILQGSRDTALLLVRLWWLAYTADSKYLVGWLAVMGLSGSLLLFTGSGLLLFLGILEDMLYPA
jgi:hypothetical protein